MAVDGQRDHDHLLVLEDAPGADARYPEQGWQDPEQVLLGQDAERGRFRGVHWVAKALVFVLILALLALGALLWGIFSDTKTPRDGWLVMVQSAQNLSKCLGVTRPTPRLEVRDCSDRPDRFFFPANGTGKIMWEGNKKYCLDAPGYLTAFEEDGDGSKLLLWDCSKAPAKNLHFTWPHEAKEGEIRSAAKDGHHENLCVDPNWKGWQEGPMRMWQCQGNSGGNHWVFALDPGFLVGPRYHKILGRT